jgi:hypothetical protein
VLTEEPNCQGYERVSTDEETLDSLVSAEDDDTEMVSDEVS